MEENQLEKLGDYILFHRSKRKGVFRVSFRDDKSNHTLESNVSYLKALELAVAAIDKLRSGADDRMMGVCCDEENGKEEG